MGWRVLGWRAGGQMGSVVAVARREKQQQTEDDNAEELK